MVDRQLLMTSRENNQCRTAIVQCYAPIEKRIILKVERLSSGLIQGGYRSQCCVTHSVFDTSSVLYLSYPHNL